MRFEGIIRVLVSQIITAHLEYIRREKTSFPGVVFLGSSLTWKVEESIITQ
jgi:hypothetical protein